MEKPKHENKEDKIWIKREICQELIPLDLHTAASIGHYESVQHHLMCQSDLNKKNKGGWTALMYAAYCGHRDVTHYLLQEGSNLNLKNNKGQTPLMLAAMCDNHRCALDLIEYGASVDETDYSGCTALFYTAECGHQNTLTLLLEKGASVNSVEHRTGFTPLMVAIRANHEVVVRNLLLHGADITMKNNDGDSVMSLTSKMGNPKIISLIECLTSHNSLQDISIFNGPMTAKQMLSAARNCPQYMKEAASSPNFKLHSLSLLMDKLDLSKYYHIFENQSIDLATFLTLTDKDLKEIGIKLLGPRRKMTTAIARWHENVPVITNPLEKAYASKLLTEKQELSRKLEEVNSQLNQERELRNLIENTAAAERQGWTTMLSKLRFIQEQMFVLSTQIRSLNNAVPYVAPNIVLPKWQYPTSHHLLSPDNSNSYVDGLSIELCDQVDILSRLLSHFNVTRT